MTFPASIATRAASAAEAPHYNLFIGGAWVRSSRNARVHDYNSADGLLYARAGQAGEEGARKAE
jgi:hypothetical protein